MNPGIPTAIRVSTSRAREHLAEIVMRVQDPRAYCILTRHGKQVAAVVSMNELQRIWNMQGVEDVRKGRGRQKFYWGPNCEALTQQEAAEAVLNVQLDRRGEREVLERSGLEPVEGGEVLMEVPRMMPPKRRRWWKLW